MKLFDECDENTKVILENIDELKKFEKDQEMLNKLDQLEKNLEEMKEIREQMKSFIK